MTDRFQKSRRNLKLKKGTKLNSEMILKNLVLRQQHQMETISDLDDETKVSRSARYNRVSTLRTIAAEVRQIEVGEQWMRGKCGSRPYLHQLEDDPKELSPLARIMSEFDPVDRSIIRELCLMHLDAIQRGEGAEFTAFIQQTDARLKREAAGERANEPPSYGDS